MFLTQGLGLGIAIGVTYVPGLAVLSHYFQRRRPLAMGIAASVSPFVVLCVLSLEQAFQGSAVGGALHPIMLNAWFHGSVGFHKGVRASAGLNLGLLVIALLLMKPRLPPSPQKEGPVKSLRTFSKDVPFVIMVGG